MHKAREREARKTMEVRKYKLRCIKAKYCATCHGGNYPKHYWKIITLKLKKRNLGKANVALVAPSLSVLRI